MSRRRWQHKVTLPPPNHTAPGGWGRCEKVWWPNPFFAFPSPHLLRRLTLRNAAAAINSNISLRDKTHNSFYTPSSLTLRVRRDTWRFESLPLPGCWQALRGTVEPAAFAHIELPELESRFRLGAQQNGADRIRVLFRRGTTASESVPGCAEY